LAAVKAEAPIDNFAIEVDGASAGGAGLSPRGGEQQGVAEFGYWMSRAYLLGPRHRHRSGAALGGVCL
jgi:hypothetical protein